MKKVLLGLLAIFCVAQFFQPDKNSGDPVDLEVFYTETKASEEVKSILKESCNDCHSSNTVYPWYSKITPVNYFLANHVEDGKKHLDFSSWSSYDAKKKEHKLDEVAEMVEKKEMPLSSYTIIHQNAKLDEKQSEVLIKWAKDAQKMY